MTLILENGSGVIGANSYADAAYVLAYLTDRGREAENLWSTSDTAAQETFIIQATDYVENDPFPADTHEQALDKLTMLAQQNEEQLDRTLSSPTSATITNGELPAADVVANYILRVNAAATGFEAVSATDAALSGSLTPTDGNFIVGDGTDFVVESGATARTSIGLGTGNNVTFTNVTGSGTLNITGTITGPSGTWDSGGVDIAASDSYAVAGTAILSDSSGTMTLSNIDRKSVV